MTNDHTNYKITDEEKKKILAGYLKSLAMPYTQDELKYFTAITDKVENLLIYSSNTAELKKFATYILLVEGWREYLSCTSNQLVDIHLNSENLETKMTRDDIYNVPVLIIYHPAYYRSNRILFETMISVISQRLSEFKKVIVLSEITIKKLEDTGLLRMQQLKHKPKIDTYDTYNNNNKAIFKENNSIMYVPKNSNFDNLKNKVNEGKLPFTTKASESITDEIPKDINSFNGGIF